MAIENDKAGSGVDSALRWIGDLDHPFYQDERQRFIWYEASAIGLQLIIMLQLVLAGVAAIVFGSDSFRYIGFGLLPTVLTALVAVAYAHRHGAQYFVQSSDLRRSRGLFGLGLVALYVVGAIRVGFDGVSGGPGGGFDWGYLLGFVAGLIGVGVGVWIAKKKNDTAETALDD